VRRYYSPKVLEALRDHAARGGLEGASAWDCTAILVGLAQLNYGAEEGEGERGCGGARRAARTEPHRSGSGMGLAAGNEEVDLVRLLAETVARRVSGGCVRG
jgi:hypothetical protein